MQLEWTGKENINNFVGGVSCSKQYLNTYDGQTDFSSVFSAVGNRRKMNIK
jgi:hypothetical protein